MINFYFSEKGLALVYSPHFAYVFLWKILIRLYSINWPNFSDWLPLLLKILRKMSSIKYVRSGSVILDPPSPCTCTYTFSLHPLPLVRANGYDFLKKMWERYFVNYYESKNQKQRYKIKKLLYKAIGKFWIKAPIRALG